MKSLILSICLSFLLYNLSAQNNIIPHQFLISLQNDSKSLSPFRSFLSKNQCSIKKTVPTKNPIYLIDYKGNQTDQFILQLLQRHPNIAYAQHHHKVKERSTNQIPDDEFWEAQWNLDRIGMTKAWDITTGGTSPHGDTIVVAIIDSGFDTNHEDLKQNIWYNSAEIDDDSLDNDGNGYIDDVLGWNFQGNSDQHLIRTHGTAVSGFIGAKGNNEDGIAGINWDIKLMLLSQALTEIHVVEAYTYAINMRRKYNETNGQEGAFVVATNLSFGADFAQPEDYPLWCAVYDELGEVGILNAVATTNGSSLGEVNVDIEGDVPSACPSDYIITVTNSDINDEKYVSAGYGLTTIDLAAPGDGAFTTTAWGNYSTYGGTSSASPHVAGAIALMYASPLMAFAEDAKRDPAEAALLIKNFLLNGVDQLDNFKGRTVSGGRLNIFNSFQIMENYYRGFDDNTRIKKLYPNPSQTIIYVDYEAIDNSPLIFSMYNSIGQLVDLNQITPQEFGFRTHEITINHLADGVYFLVMNNGKERNIQKFIKVK